MEKYKLGEYKKYLNAKILTGQCTTSRHFFEWYGKRLDDKQIRFLSWQTSHGITSSIPTGACYAIVFVCLSGEALVRLFICIALTTILSPLLPQPTQAAACHRVGLSDMPEQQWQRVPLRGCNDITGCQGDRLVVELLCSAFERTL